MNAPQHLPVIYSMSDLEKMASQMVTSKLFGVTNVSQAVTLMLLAQSEGLHPATAARDYHIIQGRPSMKADTMLARFQASGGIVEWQDYTDTKVSATFKHPQSPRPVLIEWTLEMAKKVGLTGKDNWKNYPRAMLRARVISEGVRTCFPVVSPGIYAPEEVEHFSPEKDITPTAGYFASLPVKRQEVLSETARLIREHMESDRPLDAFQLWDDPSLDAEEKIALHSLLPSNHRSALKRLQDAERAEVAGTVTPAQKKRLEARIGELKLDREAIKRHCADAYGVSHFSALTPTQYQELDAALESMASGKTTESAARPSPPPASGPPADEDVAADLIDEREEGAILDLLTAGGIDLSKFLRAANVPSVGKLAKADLARAKDWIARASA